MKTLIWMLFVLSLSGIFGCSKVTPLAEDEQKVDLSESILSGSRYIKNQSMDLFQIEPWYIYDEANHIIWPNFNVYVIRAEGRYFKIQFIDYYDTNNLPGSYTIRIQEEGKPFFIWKFDAAACGNIYTNPDFEKCMNDPQQNIFTYLNLVNQTQFKMNNSLAKLASNWHIAFNGTNIKINSGESGPGNTRVGLLYKYRPFYRGKNVDWQKIAEQAFGKKGWDFFQLDYNYQKVSFFLPQGVKRVVNEPDWFRKIPNVEFLRQANPNHWWVLKHPEQNAYSKFRVKEINETRLSNDTIDTQITLEYYLQTSGAENFETTPRLWELETFNSATERVKWCLNFELEQVQDCEDDETWDLRVSVFNWDPLYDEDREWKLLVNEGAFGPISKEDMQKIRDGRE